MSNISDLWIKLKNLILSKNTSKEDIDVNIMAEEFTLESPIVEEDIIFKVLKSSINSDYDKMVPQFSGAFISDFEVLESLEKNYKELDNQCGEEPTKIIGTYYLNQKYISAGISYNSSILQDGYVYDFARNFITILPFEYCGDMYVPNPVAKDFIVSLEAVNNILSPFLETKDYYLYQVKVMGKIYLITFVEVDADDINTLAQLNTELGKASDNKQFTLKELSKIKKISYELVDTNSIDMNIFRYLPNLYELKMINCMIDTIFPELLDLVGLQTLNLNDNRLSDLSLFKEKNITVHADGQNIDFGILEKSSTSTKYELDFNFLRDNNDEVPDVSCSSGTISDNVIVWKNDYMGSDVSFQFSNNEEFSGNVYLYLKNYNYEINSDGVIIKYTPYEPTVKVVDIPRYINGIEVKAIGENAFAFYEDITSVIIPDSVTVIEKSAFENCSSLTSVSLPNEILSIESSTFYNCRSLRSINIPDKVTSIGKKAFEGCSSLASINLPNSLIFIEERTFKGCENLLSISMQNSVESIGMSAFENCSSLTSISLPNNVTTIEERTFAGCENLLSISIPQSVVSIESGAFDGCSNIVSISLPNIITSINDSTFNNCRKLQSIIIPNGVTFIGNYAFAECYSLTALNIPLGVTHIGSYAFYACIKITTINIPEGVTVIEDGTFKRCVVLSLNTIPEGVTSIGNSAFEECYGFITMQLPEKVTFIGNLAFSYCRNLTSINIPDGVTSIGNEAFDNCNMITTMQLPDKVTSIGDRAFYNCYGITSINMPTHLTSIGSHTFQYCRGITSLDIPNSVISIGEGAFLSCTNLTNINIPNSLTKIESMIFTKCNKLLSMNIPNSVTYIGYHSFEGCSSLTYTDIPDSVESIDNLAFAESGVISIKIPYKVCREQKYIFTQCYNINSITISATSQEVAPSLSIEELRNIWISCAYNLSIYYTDCIPGKYMIIDGVLKDLR